MDLGWRITRTIAVSILSSILTVGTASAQVSLTRVPAEPVADHFQLVMPSHELIAGGESGQVPDPVVLPPVTVTHQVPRHGRLATIRSLFGAEAASRSKRDSPKRAFARGAVVTVSGWRVE